MKRKNENGEVVVEASLVVTIVAIFISVMFYIGMILYQQSLVSIMANRTASNIAQVYSNNIKDTFTGYVDSDSIYQSITYSNMKTDAYIDVISQKAKTLAFYRLKSAKILNSESASVDVEIVNKPHELLKSQVIITINDKYELPLVSMFGVDNKLTFSATGRADCVDILEYINGVQAIGDPEHSNVTYLPDSDICLIRFYDNEFDNNLVATVPVLKGKSILSSNRYTHSVMPKNPYSSRYEFAGWVSNGSGFFATTEINDDISVYGTWKCTVTLNPEGGNVSPTSKKVEWRTVTEIPTPTRSGYTFLGWFTQKNGIGTQYFSNTTVINDNVTLYANWKCNHHYVLSSHTAGNCRKKEHYIYKCSQCGHIIENDGNYGPHAFGGVFLAWKAPDCRYRDVYRKTCSICGKVEEYYGDNGGHYFNARCGKEHNLGNNAFRISSHSGGRAYQKTTIGECYLCEYCGAPYDGWTIRNGQVVSRGMICIQHLYNGRRVRDAYLKNCNTNLHTHG